MHEHAEHEDNIIFPEVQNQEPEMIKILTDEHKAIERNLDKLNLIIEEILTEQNDAERLIRGDILNSAFNDFSAMYLSHMNHEEETVLGASWKYLDDKELIGIRTRIQSKIPPERYRIWLDWMLKSLNNVELAGLLGGMKASAPQQVFNNLISTAEKIIEPERWQVLKKRISL